MGVNVLLNQQVTDYKDNTVYINDGSTIASETFIWVTGVIAHKLENMPSEKLGRGARIIVNAYNQVEGMEGVYCIGDQCIMPNVDKDYLGGHPQLAQVAIQQGNLLADNLKRLSKGNAHFGSIVPFRPRERRSVPSCRH